MREKLHVKHLSVCQRRTEDQLDCKQPEDWPSHPLINQLPAGLYMLHLSVRSNITSVTLTLPAAHLCRSWGQLFKRFNLDLEIPCFAIQDHVTQLTLVSVFQSKIGVDLNSDPETHFLRFPGLLVLYGAPKGTCWRVALHCIYTNNNFLLVHLWWLCPCSLQTD